MGLHQETDFSDKNSAQSALFFWVMAMYILAAGWGLGMCQVAAGSRTGVFAILINFPTSLVILHSCIDHSNELSNCFPEILGISWDT